MDTYHWQSLSIRLPHQVPYCAKDSTKMWHACKHLPIFIVLHTSLLILAFWPYIYLFLITYRISYNMNQETPGLFGKQPNLAHPKMSSFVTWEVLHGIFGGGLPSGSWSKPFPCFSPKYIILQTHLHMWPLKSVPYWFQTFPGLVSVHIIHRKVLSNVQLFGGYFLHLIASLEV